MALAERTQLMDLLAENVVISTSKVRFGAANRAPKLTTLIAGMFAGSDCIDLLLRSGGMKHLFGSVYAPSTVGTLLREFNFGHNRQLESVLRHHLIALTAHTARTARTDILPGIADRAFVDIDSLLRPVYGHAKQGASFGHAKVAGKQILRAALTAPIVLPATAPPLSRTRHSLWLPIRRRRVRKR